MFTIILISAKTKLYDLTEQWLTSTPFSCVQYQFEKLTHSSCWGMLYYCQNIILLDKRSIDYNHQSSLAFLQCMIFMKKNYCKYITFITISIKVLSDGRLFGNVYIFWRLENAFRSLSRLIEVMYQWRWLSSCLH